ncbi:MAG: trypsin-like peptidase domain-containing protein, partial [Planctomycetaceae bacterium]
ASSEPSIGGLTPEEFLDQQLQLHEWLMSELPDGTLDAPIRVPLTKQDRRAIANDSTPRPRPRRVGIVKRVGKNVKIWRGRPIAKAPTRLAHGVIQGTDDGGFVWAVVLESENAAALRVHLSVRSLPDSADVYFFGLDGQAHGPYRGRDEFWTNSLMGSQGIVLVRQFGPVAAGSNAMSISVASVGNITEQFANDARFPLCDYNHPCIENAEGYGGEVVDDLKLATAYIEWVQGAWIYSCSGGLLNDQDEGSQIPYFLTANHCIKSNAAARNLELFWNYTTSNGNCTGPIGSMTMGATVQAASGKGDFTLLELNDSPPDGSVFMGWTSAEVATVSGEPLHRVHHPKGAPQSYTTHVTDPDFGTCGGLPIPQFIYSLDTLGSTEGGSSGSLVTNDAGEVVGQLYGGCGSNFDECFSDDWRTVDGAFSFYFDKVSGFLAAPSCEPTVEICDDGLDNDCDTDIDCSDSECTLDPYCVATCEPKNAMCSIDSDCCSGICKRNGRCR